MTRAGPWPEVVTRAQLAAARGHCWWATLGHHWMLDAATTAGVGDIVIDMWKFIQYQLQNYVDVYEV